MEEDIKRLEEMIAKLRRDFDEHRHTGLDSKSVDLTDQIESQGSLTYADNSGVDNTYGAEEQSVIVNMRTRIGEIETALKGFGILS